MFKEFWDKTITIFSPFTNNGGIDWYKYIIKNAFVKRINNKIDNGMDYSNSNRTIIRIDNDNYVPFHKWISLSDVDKQYKPTIYSESIIVLEEITDDSILEKLKDNSGSFLFDDYECTKPLSVTDNTYQYLPHILITGD